MRDPCKNAVLSVSDPSASPDIGPDIGRVGESGPLRWREGALEGRDKNSSNRSSDIRRNTVMSFGKDLLTDKSSYLTIGRNGMDSVLTGQIAHKEPENDLAVESRSIGLAGKRFFDLIFAVAMLIVFAPLLLVLYGIVRFSSEGPGVFRQLRVGKGGELFYCLKFRTMVVDAQERLRVLLETDPDARREWDETQKLRNDPRITPIGNFLRKTSLDELPQLWNILVGEMSVVGPRPIVEDEVKRYGKSFDYYCAGRPGLTGPWQVSGRNDISYSERVKLDRNYVLNRSFVGDFVICLKTVPAVVASHGTY